MKITGGMAPVILGVAPEPAPDVPRETPLELYERLRNGRPDRFAAWRRVNRAVERGLLELLGSSRGPTVDRAASAKPAWLTARPDGWNGDSLLLVKCLPWLTADAWSVDGPPPYLLVSVQHELLATGARRCEGGVLLAGNAWRTWSMRANPQFQASLLEAEQRFVDGLARGMPPAVSDEIDLEVIRRLFPLPGGERRVLPAGATAMWERAKMLRQTIRAARKRRAVIEARLRELMVGCYEVRLQGGRRLTLRTVRAPGGQSGTRLVELH